MKTANHSKSINSGASYQPLIEPNINDPYASDSDNDNTTHEDSNNNKSKDKKVCYCYKSRKRCCIWSLVWILLILATLICLFQFIFFHSILQDMVNSSTMTFLNVTMLNAGNTSLTLEAKARLDHKSAGLFTAYLPSVWLEIRHPGDVCVAKSPNYHPNAPSDVPKIVNDCTIGYVKSPPMVLSGSSSIIELSSTLYVLNDQMFNVFGSDLIETTLMKMSVHTQCDVELGMGSNWGIKVKDIKLDKETSIKGLDGLPNVTMGVFDASITKSGDVQVNITVYVNNPSIVNIVPMGNLFFGMYYRDVLIGHVHAQDVTVYQGRNAMPLLGIIIYVPDMLDDLFSHYLTMKPVELYARGNTSTIATNIPLYNTVLRELNLHTTMMPLAKPLAVIGEMNVTAEELMEAVTKGGSYVAVSLTVHNPFAAWLQFHHLNLYVTYDGATVGLGDTSERWDKTPLDFIVSGKSTVPTPFVPVFVNASTWQQKFAVGLSLRDLGDTDHYTTLGMYGSFIANVGPKIRVESHVLQVHNIITCLSGNTTYCDNYLKHGNPWNIDKQLKLKSKRKSKYSQSSAFKLIK